LRLKKNKIPAGRFLEALIADLSSKNLESFQLLVDGIQAQEPQKKPAENPPKTKILPTAPRPKRNRRLLDGYLDVSDKVEATPPAVRHLKTKETPFRKLFDIRDTQGILPTNKPDQPTRLTVLEGEGQGPETLQMQKVEKVETLRLTQEQSDSLEIVVEEDEPPSAAAVPVEIPEDLPVAIPPEPPAATYSEEALNELLERIHYPGNSTAAEVLESYQDLRYISDHQMVCPRHWKQIDEARKKRREILLKWKGIWEPLRASLQEFQEKEAKETGREKRVAGLKLRTKEQELLAFEERIQLGKRPELRAWLEEDSAAGDDIELPVRALEE